jgi:hypothetical protein
MGCSREVVDEQVGVRDRDRQQLVPIGSVDIAATAIAKAPRAAAQQPQLF